MFGVGFWTRPRSVDPQPCEGRSKEDEVSKGALPGWTPIFFIILNLFKLKRLFSDLWHADDQSSKRATSAAFTEEEI